MLQLAMPEGAEDRARSFDSGVLGMIELPKPPELAKRGGCWFGSGDVQMSRGRFSACAKGPPGAAMHRL